MKNIITSSFNLLEHYKIYLVNKIILTKIHIIQIIIIPIILYLGKGISMSDFILLNEFYDGKINVTKLFETKIYAKLKTEDKDENTSFIFYFIKIMTSICARGLNNYHMKYKRVTFVE